MNVDALITWLYSSITAISTTFLHWFSNIIPSLSSSRIRVLILFLTRFSSIGRSTTETFKVMFKNFWGSQEQQAQPCPQELPTNSWYPSSVVSSPSASRPMSPGPSTSSSLTMTRLTDELNTLSNLSPAEAAGISATLKDKSVDELKKLLADKDAYQNLLFTLEPFKTRNRVREELGNETLQLARENLEKEPIMVELRNQCRIIRTTELASAHEKLHELERKKEDILKYNSPSSLFHQLQEAMNKTEEESETVHRQLLERELDLTDFVQKYKKMRYVYHKRALTHLAISTSVAN